MDNNNSNNNEDKFLQSIVSQLPSLISNISKLVHLQPKCFFLAFHGTLTFAFSGWSSQLLHFKSQIDKSFNGIIHNENYGTKWPKITFGLLPDGVSLTRTQFQRILRLILDENQNLEISDHSQTREFAREIQLVCYEKRSLEPPYKAIYRWDIDKQAAAVEVDEIAEESRTFVDTITKEAQDTDFYFQETNNQSRRKNFYTETCTPEYTLVHFINSGGILDLLAELRGKIEREFPGLYYWVPTDALHVSLRAFNPKRP